MRLPSGNFLPPRVGPGSASSSEPVSAVRFTLAGSGLCRRDLRRLRVTATVWLHSEPIVDEHPGGQIRTKLLQAEELDATTPLTVKANEQPQRGLNPCLHLERVPEDDSSTSRHGD